MPSQQTRHPGTVTRWALQHMTGKPSLGPKGGILDAAPDVWPPWDAARRGGAHLSSWTCTFRGMAAALRGRLMVMALGSIVQALRQGSDYLVRFTSNRGVAPTMGYPYHLLVGSRYEPAGRFVQTRCAPYNRTAQAYCKGYSRHLLAGPCRNPSKGRHRQNSSRHQARTQRTDASHDVISRKREQPRGPGVRTTQKAHGTTSPDPFPSSFSRL